MKKFFGVCIAVSAASMGLSQSFNIEIDTQGTTPSSSFGAVGLAGTWNTVGIGSQPANVSGTNILGLNGVATAADFSWQNLQWFTSMTLPSGSADERALLQDAANASGPFSFSSLLNGLYDVILYTIPTGVPQSTTFTIGQQSLTTSGAGWTGSFIEGATHVKFSNVSVTDGTLSILTSVDPFGGMSGLQLVYRGDAPVPEPFTMTLLGAAAVAGYRRIKRGRTV